MDDKQYITIGLSVASYCQSRRSREKQLRDAICKNHFNSNDIMWIIQMATHLSPAGGVVRMYVVKVLPSCTVSHDPSEGVTN